MYVQSLGLWQTCSLISNYIPSSLAWSPLFCYHTIPPPLSQRNLLFVGLYVGLPSWVLVPFLWMFNQSADFPLLDHSSSAIPALSPSLHPCYQPPYLKNFSNGPTARSFANKLPMIAIFFQAGVAVLSLVCFALFSILGIPYRDFYLFQLAAPVLRTTEILRLHLTPILARKIPIAPCPILSW